MKFDKYELKEELGSGSFGIVYKAVDLNLNRTVAVKVLHPNLVYIPGLLEKFRQEARLAAQLSHPNIVPVYDFGQFEGQNFLTMAYMPGGSLRDSLLARAPLKEDEAYKIFNDLVMGVEHAHGRGIVHRDLKPSNILFDSEGIARITDLGFAKTLTTENSQSMSMSGGMVGTPHYMAPELWEGKKVTPAVDLYSLGCILYEMLSGEKLFDGETTPVVMTKHFRPIELTANLSEKNAAIIRKLTEKSPENRYSSVKELHDALFTKPVTTAKEKPVSPGGGSDRISIQKKIEHLTDIAKPPKGSLFQSQLSTQAVFRYALFFLLVFLLFGGVVAAGAKNGWFEQDSAKATITSTLTATSTDRKMSSPTQRLTSTRTRTPTKSVTSTKAATTLALSTATFNTHQVTTTAPVVFTYPPVIPTQPPVAPTQPPVTPTHPPVAPTQPFPTDPPVLTRGPTPTPP